MRAVRKSYGSHEVLRGIDLEVARGTVIGYIGANGAGKSTTLKILVGLLRDFDGEARVGGIDVAQDPVGVKSIIGYVPENASLYEALTAHEYLTYAGRLHGVSEGRIARRAAGFLAALDLEGRAHSRIGTFSKGMRQKLLIASALIHDPAVLLLDEPLTGLDVEAMLLVKDLLRGLADRGRAVLYSSHVMEVVERICDRVAVLHDGRLVAVASPEELKAASGDATLADAFRRLARFDPQASRVNALLDELEP
jgi:ABC-2 type transport system ATP-binding protein